MMGPTATDAASGSKRRLAVRFHRGHNLTLAPHPDAPDPLDLAAVRRWVREQRAHRLTALDLFCGAGGLSLGLERAGFRVLVGADIATPNRQGDQSF
jgi:C-5 cytosine-specific DNA methylase